MNVVIATLMAALAIGAPGHHHQAGQRQGGQRQYEVIWTNPCPVGFLCKIVGEQLEPNYAQALKLATTLTQEDYRVEIIQVQA